MPKYEQHGKHVTTTNGNGERIVYATCDDEGEAEQLIKLLNGESIERAGKDALTEDMARSIYIQLVSRHDMTNEKAARLAIDAAAYWDSVWH